MSDADARVEKLIAEKLKHFVLLHHASFWFLIIVLLIALVTYILYMRLAPHVKPEQCLGVQNNHEAKNIEPALQTLSYIGVFLTSFAVLFISLHYFHPFVRV